jgi:hypothetical protein
MSFYHTAKDTTERRDPMQEFANRIVVQLETGVMRSSRIDTRSARKR